MKSFLLFVAVLFAACLFLAPAQVAQGGEVYATVAADVVPAAPGDQVAMTWPFTPPKPAPAPVVVPPAVTPPAPCCPNGACTLPPAAACTPPAACTPSACGSANESEASGRRHPVLKIVKAVIGHQRRAERRAGRQED